MTAVSTKANILVQSLTPDISLFRQKVHRRNETRAYALAIKMLGFIETDREFLWPSNDLASDMISEHEDVAVNSLTQLCLLMRCYDAIVDGAPLLAAMMVECARLLLLFNGDDISDHFIDRDGMCYVVTPALRPRYPLATKFGICKLHFVRNVHPVNTSRPPDELNIDALDYDQISACASPQLDSGKAVEWQSFSVWSQMNDILDKIEAHDSM